MPSAKFLILALVLLAPASSRAQISEDLEDLRLLCADVSRPFDQDGYLFTRSDASTAVSELSAAAGSLSGSATAAHRRELVLGVRYIQCFANSMAHRYGFSDHSNSAQGQVLTLMATYSTLFPSAAASAALAGENGKRSQISRMPLNLGETQKAPAGDESNVEALSAKVKEQEDESGAGDNPNNGDGLDGGASGDDESSDGQTPEDPDNIPQ